MTMRWQKMLLDETSDTFERDRAELLRHGWEQTGRADATRIILQRELVSYGPPGSAAA